MLDPSSSEEESENEAVEDESSGTTIHPSSATSLELPRSGSATRSVSPGGSTVDSHVGAISGSTGGSSSLSSRAGTVARPSSPSPSMVSEKEPSSSKDKQEDAFERAEKEEEERKKRLQLYVFVLRCIAYPFNAKQPTDMTRR